MRLLSISTVGKIDPLMNAKSSSTASKTQRNFDFLLLMHNFGIAKLFALLYSTKIRNYSKTPLTKKGDSDRILRLQQRQALARKQPHPPSRKYKKVQKTLKKGIDKEERMWYNSQVAAGNCGDNRSLKIEQ